MLRKALRIMDIDALLQSYSSCCAKHCDANGKTDLDKARFDFGKILAEMSNDECIPYQSSPVQYHTSTSTSTRDASENMKMFVFKDL